ncbi:MAG: DJ-1/PfpI family protein [Piscinibacter sp.]|uniref:DJ-1/PfpI family protein n=1 Tax=Piscinibacter sp. TaxID=1903157 RepID=UPI003D0E9544
MTKPLRVGIHLFDNMTMLDGYAPLQALSFVPGLEVTTFAKSTAPLRSDCGAMLLAAHDLVDCPALDVLVMPGGGDVLPQMQDPDLQAFLRERANDFAWVTSVCTGSLILAEAGLLDGYRATTHWGWLPRLARYPGIEVADERVVVDRNRVTGGGITAGLDFALTLAATVVGDEAAQAAQLVMQYEPVPPYACGHPARAPAPLTAAVRGMVDQRCAALDAWLDRRT